MPQRPVRWRKHTKSMVMIVKKRRQQKKVTPNYS
jgi:hypothetical protein